MERSAPGNWLAEQLSKDGLDVGSTSARFRQSLDIIAGRKTVYVQQPRVYYFPGLPNVQFFDREQFDWVSELEGQTDAIRDELVALQSSRDSFGPHVAARGPADASGHDRMAGNSSWSSADLYKNGVPYEPNTSRCPATMAALSKVPLPHFSSTSPGAPAVMFSILKAGARIPPHTGSTNVRLICHLPLIVPPDCGFRVGNEVRQWEVGKVLIFDDTIEHEVWNRSSQDRAVLIFDIWRPDLSEGERRGVTALFQHREKVATPRG